MFWCGTTRGTRPETGLPVTADTAKGSGPGRGSGAAGEGKAPSNGEVVVCTPRTAEQTPQRVRPQWERIGAGAMRSASSTPRPCQGKSVETVRSSVGGRDR